MRHALTPLFAAAAVILAGCTSAPPAQDPPPPATVAPAIASAAAEQETLTGSRIPKRGGGDRTVKTIGAREARDTLDSMPKPFDSR